jgi:hypothetical protein
MTAGTFLHTIALFAFAFALGGGCAHPTTQDPPRVPSGQWGGQHVRMTITDAGAELEFDCAHGRIDEPLTLDRSGRFGVRGTYSPEQPGPRREDEDRGRAVRYNGKVDGTSMVLTIDAGEGSSDLGSYTLERGKEPTIRKCL